MSNCCKKPKNPCMVCMRTVTNKTGLQCQGSCKAWIHYACCSYTPGKIKDIKAKIIKVRCPCPDCTPQVPKEEIVKENSFSCVNQKCPANMAPKCEHKKCPVNKLSQMPSTCQKPPKCPQEWPGVPCGTACKKNSSSKRGSTTSSGDKKCSPPPKCPPPPYPPPPCPPPPCPPLPCAPPPCNKLPCPPLPCPPLACPPLPCLPTQPPCPSQRPGTVMPSISAVENMCETVGLLSDQLNQLMCKMTNVLSPKPGGTANPCYCPQNPNRRN